MGEEKEVKDFAPTRRSTHSVKEEGEFQSRGKEGDTINPSGDDSVLCGFLRTRRCNAPHNK